MIFHSWRLSYVCKLDPSAHMRCIWFFRKIRSDSTPRAEPASPPSELGSPLPGMCRPTTRGCAARARSHRPSLLRAIGVAAHRTILSPLRRPELRPSLPHRFSTSTIIHGGGKASEGEGEKGVVIYLPSNRAWSPSNWALTVSNWTPTVSNRAQWPSNRASGASNRAPMSRYAGPSPTARCTMSSPLVAALSSARHCPSGTRRRPWVPPISTPPCRFPSLPPLASSHKPTTWGASPHRPATRPPPCVTAPISRGGPSLCSAACRTFSREEATWREGASARWRKRDDMRKIEPLQDRTRMSYVSRGSREGAIASPKPLG
jgi:hypothetical protein